MCGGLQPRKFLPGRGLWAPAFFRGCGRKRGFFGFLLFLVLSPTFAGVVESSLTLLKVPFHQQTAHQCGPAALASILNFWGNPVTPEAVSEAVFSSEARGTLTLDLYLFAKNQGYNVQQGALDLEAVREEIRGGRPVLLLVDEGFWIVRQGHFLVITGFDDNGLFVHDGNKKDVHEDYPGLLRKWERTGRWGMFLSPGEGR